MKTSPAEVLKFMLVQQSILTNASTKGAWPCYVSAMPDGAGVADNAVCAYDTSPLLDGRYMRTGENVEHPGVQFKVRAVDYRTGWNKAQEIAAYLDTVLRSAFAIEDFQYVVQSISTGGVLPLGQEEGTTKRRYLFTLNCNATLSSVQS
jgi:hypothetical protein